MKIQSLGSLISDMHVVAQAWCFRDETTLAIGALMVRVADSGVVVPAIRRLEVANRLHTGGRRGRIAGVDRDGSLADLADTDSGHGLPWK